MTQLPGSPIGGSTGGSYTRLPGAPVGSGLGSSSRLPGSAPSLRATPRQRLRSINDLPHYDDMDLGKIDKNRMFDKRYQAALKMRYSQVLRRKFGLDVASSFAAAEIAWQRDVQGVSRGFGGGSFLSAVGKVAAIPEQAVVGFLHGQQEYLGKHVKSKNPWDQLAETVVNLPKSFVGGYHGAGQAIHKHEDAGTYLRQSYPGLPKVAGLGASMVFDPVMYLSFGATAPSKIAAMTGLRVSAHEAMRRADVILKTKGGMYFGKKFNDPVELMQAIRINDRMPLDLPSALDHLHQTGLATKASMRRLKAVPAEGINEAIKPTLGRVAAAYIAPRAVRGGRGVRFGGIEVPGTAELGAKLGAKFRGSAEETLRSQDHPVAQFLAHSFATNPQLRMMGEDTIRALALGDMALYKTEIQAVKRGAIEEAQDIAKGGTTKYIPPKERLHALEKPIIQEMYHGGPEQLASFDIGKSSPFGAVGPAFYLSPKKELAQTFAGNRWGLMGELKGATAEKGAITKAKVPEGLKLYNADQVMPPEVKQAVLDSLDDIARVHPDAAEEMAHIKAALASNSKLTLHDLRDDLPGFGIDFQEASDRWGEGFFEGGMGDFWSQFIPKMEQLGYTGAKYKPTHEMYEAIAKEDLPESEVAIWSQKVADELIMHGRDMPKLPKGVSMSMPQLAEMWDPVRPMTKEFLADHPWATSFPVLFWKDGSDIRIGAPGMAHEDALSVEEANRFFAGPPGTVIDPEGLPFHEGTGLFDPETGKVATINFGNYVANKPGVFATAQRAGLKVSEEDMNKAMKAAREIFEPKALSPKDTIVQQVHERVAQEIAAAKAVKIPEGETKDLWSSITAQTNDPIEAIGMFVFQNQIKVHARRFTSERILGNPLYARPVEKGSVMPHGYKPFTDPATDQRYAVLGEMADALDQLVNPQVLDKSISWAVKALTMPQNYWKQFATSANPSFHVMNFLGAVWNNLFGMMYNPADYLKATTNLYRSRMEEAAQQGRSRYMGRKAISTPKTQAARALYKEASNRGATSDTASIFAEVAEGVSKRDESLVPTLPPTVSERMMQVLKRRPKETQKRYALRQSRRVAAAGMLATGNPIGVALLAPEAAAVGRVVGTTIEDVVRLAPFMKAAKDPVLKRYLDAYGPITVPGMTHPGWDKEVQTAMYDVGAALSKHFQFDYSDLTEFERKFVKMYFPFYVFYKKNFLLQAQLLATAPRGVRSAQQVMNFSNENSDLTPEMRQMLPDYFDQLSAFQVPVPAGIRKKLGLPADQPLFLNPKLPFVSLNLMPPIWNVFANTAQPTNQKVLSVFAPMLGAVGPFAPVFGMPGLKTILEASVGESLGLNKSLDYQRSQSNDYRQSWVPAPSWVGLMPGPVRDFMGIFPWGQTKKDKQGNWIMTATGQYLLSQMSTPFVNNLGQIIPTGGQDEGKARADMVSWLTGIRLIPVDTLRMHRSWAYRMESMLEGRRADLKDQGKELDPQDLESLQLVRAQIKVLESAWDRRQAELYP